MRVVVVVVVALLTACGGDDGSRRDAGEGRDGELGELMPTPPDIAWLESGTPPIAAPELTPCPDGWRSSPDASGATVCDPFPVGGPADCADGHAHFPGEAGCTPVGADCPSGEFATGLPSDGTVVYVSPAAVGGDGTEARPYGSVMEFSLTRLPIGSVIALSKGRHQGPIRITSSFDVRGACAAETSVTAGPAPALEGVLSARGATTEIRDLSVSDASRFGVVGLGPGTEVRLAGVTVERAQTSGLFVADSARLRAQTLLVVDTRARADGAFGRGLTLEAGADGEVRRAVFEQNRSSTILGDAAGGPVSLTLEDAVVRDTQAQLLDLQFGRGVAVQNGVTATVSRVLVERHRRNGLYAADAGTSLTATDVVVRDGLSEDASRRFGRGLAVGAGASADVSRAFFTRNRDTGVHSRDPGSDVSLTDVLVIDTLPREEDDELGRALDVALSAHATVRRAVVRGSHDASLTVLYDGSATLEDVLLSDNAGSLADGLFGRGVDVEHASQAELVRVAIERTRGAGIIVIETSMVSADDVVVRDTAERAADDRAGVGVAVSAGSTLDLCRALIERNAAMGILLSDDGASTLSDVIVRETRGEALEGLWGRGLTAQNGHVLDGTRLRLVANRENGALVRGDGARMTLSDVAIEGTRPRLCAEDTCPDFAAGHGAASAFGATMNLMRFVVAGSHICGLAVASGGALDAHTGIVRGNPIGACLNAPDYDVTRITTDVRYVDNEVNLQSLELPIPDAAQTGEARAR